MTTQFSTDQMAKDMSKQAEDMMAMSRQSYDALMKSNSIWMSGANTMWKSMTSMTNEAREKQAAAMKKMMSCKTWNDMAETGTQAAQEALDVAMSGATKLSEQSIKLCMEAMQPINDQASSAMQSAMQKAKAAA